MTILQSMAYEKRPILIYHKIIDVELAFHT